jgi:hypothetical protein
MRRSILWGMPIALTLASSLHAQDLAELNDLKARIWEAELAQRNFAAGLPHCSELNGTNFYSIRAIASLICTIIVARSTISSRRERLILKPGRPWNKQDADARWAQVQKRAIQVQTINPIGKFFHRHHPDTS